MSTGIVAQQTEVLSTSPSLTNTMMTNNIIINPVLSFVAALRRQVNFYFSAENLARDYYLVGLMDAEGGVPLETITRFHRMSALLNANGIVPEKRTQYVAACLRTDEASRVEVLPGERVRPRHFCGLCSFLVRPTPTITPTSAAAAITTGSRITTGSLDVSTRSSSSIVSLRAIMR